MELVISTIDIKDLIPHREPFIFLDALKEYHQGDRLVAVKAVSRSEPWCQGHFPDFVVMPGVLIIEALAQTCAAFMSLEHRSLEQTNDEQIYILLRSDIRFPKPVYPGSLLDLYVSVKNITSGYVEFKVKATQAGVTCVRGTLYVASNDKSKLAG